MSFYTSESAYFDWIYDIYVKFWYNGKNWLCNAKKFISGYGWEKIHFEVFAGLLEMEIL